jgi:hypothetical protein
MNGPTTLICVTQNGVYVVEPFEAEAIDEVDPSDQEAAISIMMAMLKRRNRIEHILFGTPGTGPGTVQLRP